MSFSYELIQKYKDFKGYTQDKQVCPDLNLSTGNVSDLKSGKRHLTANQCIFLANEMNIDQKEALLKLAIEKAKSKEESEIWSDIAKKISAACVALVMVFGLAQQPSEAHASV